MRLALGGNADWRLMQNELVAWWTRCLALGAMLGAWWKPLLAAPSSASTERHNLLRPSATQRFHQAPI
eukprot:165481-Karenia_brevis.AAC.1